MIRKAARALGVTSSFGLWLRFHINTTSSKKKKKKKKKKYN